MRRRLPKMEVLEAFLEAARAPNFRIAAERSGLSPGAFSRRIQAFSHFVGRVVFEKGPGGMRLTRAGQECHAALQPIWLNLQRAVSEMGRNDRQAQVTISLSHSLAAGWLIPRLASFRNEHPSIDVTLVTDRTATSVRSGDVDLAICAQDIDLGTLVSHRLMDIHIAPVAAPVLAAKIVRGAARLETCRLLTMRQHPDAWPWWAEKSSWDAVLPKRYTTFDVQHGMYEAAASGLGVAIGADVTVGSYLETGRLVSLGLPVVQYPGCYTLTATHSRSKIQSVRKVWRWLIQEAEIPSLWDVAATHTSTKLRPELTSTAA